VVNPSGGLISKGHPLGATGIAQCTELNWQVCEYTNNSNIVLIITLYVSILTKIVLIIVTLCEYTNNSNLAPTVEGYGW